MMVEKPEIPLSQTKNIAKVLIHLYFILSGCFVYTYEVNFSSIGEL